MLSCSPPDLPVIQDRDIDVQVHSKQNWDIPYHNKIPSPSPSLLHHQGVIMELCRTKVVKTVTKYSVESPSKQECWHYSSCNFQVSVANGSLEFSVGSIRYLQLMRGELENTSTSDVFSKWVPIILSCVLLLAVAIVIVCVVGMSWLICIKRRNRYICVQCQLRGGHPPPTHTWNIIIFCVLAPAPESHPHAPRPITRPCPVIVT